MAEPVHGNQLRSAQSLLDRFMLEADERDCAANQVDDAPSPPAKVSVLDAPVDDDN